ncbi:hypothetical protein B0H14DRAFT_3161261 [Mycena olivaceomarginata]|nr:hypothetical protein B0H14DRAFT_3161261 [Mycena olivaceomarginata]
MFSASIAFTFFLSLSGIALSAPMAETRAATVQQIQACSGVNGTGNCTPINFAPGVNEGDFDPAGCTNITDIDVKSFIMDVEDVCTLYLWVPDSAEARDMR